MFVGNIFDSAVAGIDVGDIGHSLRFASSRNCYAERQLGTSTSTTKRAFVFFLKGMCPSGLTYPIYSATTTSGGGTRFQIRLNSGQLDIYQWNGASLDFQVKTNRVFRDPIGHMMVRVVIDTGQATAANRIKVQINNDAEESSFATASYPALNSVPYFGTSGYYERWGYHPSENNPDYYLSRACVIDGWTTAPANTDFGYFNTTINEWVSNTQAQVKAYVDARGAQSSMLDFDNGSSLTTLGYDKSSKGNNFTLSGHSLTAGVNYDWMLDVPGNSFATLNPLSNLGSTFTFSNANLNCSLSAGDKAVPVSQTITSGKWYCELTITAVGSGGCSVGVIPNNYAASSQIGQSSTSYAYRSSGNKRTNSTDSAYGASYTTNDVIGIELDLDAGTLVFKKNGTSQGTAFTGLTGPVTFAFSSTSSGDTTSVAANFGQAPLSSGANYDSASLGYWKNAPSSGFKALCQANMPDVPAAYLNPRKHADAALWTGNNTVRSITQDGNGNNLQFNPELIWGKSRGSASGHLLYDIVRGVDKSLATNSTLAEDTTAGQLTAFSASPFGFQLPTDTSGYLNYNLRTYVAWLLKAGGAGVSNTAGSITSQVSANTDVGFSIVTYTGNGASATVGHGCKVNGVATAPGLIIIKRLVDSPYDWPVYHSGLTSVNYYLTLNGTAAQTNYGSSFIAPSATTFSLDASSTLLNTNTKTYVAYCFAPGFFSIFSSQGNASADGWCVDVGHKSRWVLLKNASAVGDWLMIDTSRDSYNVCAASLYPNLSNAESTATPRIDVTSRHIKCRDSNTLINGSGNTIIGISIPDVFAKYSLAR